MSTKKKDNCKTTTKTGFNVKKDVKKKGHNSVDLLALVITFFIVSGLFSIFCCVFMSYLINTRVDSKIDAMKDTEMDTLYFVSCQEDTDLDYIVKERLVGDTWLLWHGIGPESTGHQIFWNGEDWQDIDDIGLDSLSALQRFYKKKSSLDIDSLQMCVDYSQAYIDSVRGIREQKKKERIDSVMISKGDVMGIMDSLCREYRIIDSPSLYSDLEIQEAICFFEGIVKVKNSMRIRLGYLDMPKDTLILMDAD